MSSFENIEKLVRKEILDLKAYHVENHPCEVVLDANENPFPVPESLKEKIVRSLDGIGINRYPDPATHDLKKSIAARDGVSVERIIMGNGSDEIIQMILSVFCEKGGRVLFPVPTFSMYRLITQAWGGVPVECPLDENWDIDLSLFLEMMKKDPPSVIFISTPNNPTGNCFSEDRIVEILNRSDGIVVIDEAYYDFADHTFIDRLEEYPNAIILRSLSKVGMAGLRLGYCVANEKIIDYLNRIRLPYNINTFSQKIGEVILGEWNVLEEQISRIKKERDRIYGSLEKTKGITPFPTRANFILFRLEKNGRDPGDFFNKLMEKGVRIRDFSGAPHLKQCFRVTVGTEEENDAFLNALEGR